MVYVRVPGNRVENVQSHVTTAPANSRHSPRATPHPDRTLESATVPSHRVTAATQTSSASDKRSTTPSQAAKRAGLKDTSSRTWILKGQRHRERPPGAGARGASPTPGALHPLRSRCTPVPAPRATSEAPMAPEAPGGFAANHPISGTAHQANSSVPTKASFHPTTRPPHPRPHHTFLYSPKSSHPPPPLTNMDRAEHTPRAHQALRAPSPIDPAAQQAAGATPRHGAPRTTPASQQSAYIIRKEHQR